MGEVGKNMSKVNGDLFTLTYGAVVAQLLRDLEDPKQVNLQLDTMGFNIGTRLVDEFLAKSSHIVRRCQNFQEAIEVASKVGFKMFLGISPELKDWNQERTSCSLVFGKDVNPLEEFVELPSELRGSLHYSNVLGGVLRGSLEAVNFRVKTNFIKDRLAGDEVTELKVTLIEIMEDAAGDEYQEE